MFDRKETRLFLPAYELVKRSGREPYAMVERYQVGGRDVLVFRDVMTGRFVARDVALEMLEGQLRFNERLKRAI